jgi:hypothetical protein
MLAGIPRSRIRSVVAIKVSKADFCYSHNNPIINGENTEKRLTTGTSLLRPVGFAFGIKLGGSQGTILQLPKSFLTKDKCQGTT